MSLFLLLDWEGLLIDGNISIFFLLSFCISINLYLLYFIYYICVFISSPVLSVLASPVLFIRIILSLFWMQH